MAERTNGYHNGDTPLADSVHAPPAPEAAPREAEPMLGRRYAQIVGWGYHVPEKIITNHDLEQIVDTSDEWIRSRTGIEQRHVAADPSETTASLGVLAARKALAVADVHPSKLDLIIVATSSPEHIFPSTASIVQDALGATNAGAFDLSAACSGFVYGLSMARGHILAGDAEYVLVVGAETLSRIVDWTDRNTCILFGDGAGAVLLAASDVPGGILAVDLGSDGSGADLLAVPAGGSRMPASLETVSNGRIENVSSTDAETSPVALTRTGYQTDMEMDQAAVSDPELSVMPRFAKSMAFWKKHKKPRSRTPKKTQSRPRAKTLA